MASMDVISPQTVELLKRKTRSLSLARLKSYTRIADIVIGEAPSARLVRSHWMSIILVAGEHLRITFKANFMSSDVKILARQVYGNQDISIDQSTDYLKEYCNLTMGGVKNFLERNEISLGMSLAIVTRGFDEVFYPPMVGKQCFVDRWSLRCGDAKIECCTIYEINGEFQLKDDRSTNIDEGQVEFF
jgi:hypothetical protein